VCLTTNCIEGSIDEWINGTSGAGLMFDIDVTVSVHKAMFGRLTPSTSTGVDVVSLLTKALSDSIANQDQGLSLIMPLSLLFLHTTREALRHQHLPVCVCRSSPSESQSRHSSLKSLVTRCTSACT
jgi:hypothetical protein